MSYASLSVPATPIRSHYDVVIVGGGHNSLVAASYLGRCGLRVLVCESGEQVGGATQSVRAFAGIDARVSRYSYLVSLLPREIIADLGLRLQTRTRQVSSYSPYSTAEGVHTGLLVADGTLADASAASFAALGAGEQQRFASLNSELSRLAQAFAPTLLGPVPSREQARRALGDDALFDAVASEPIGAFIKSRVHSDLLRGVVATDALIGTFADPDVDLAANACFLYHVIGDGDGTWRVPVGGMGALVGELLWAASNAGAEIITGMPVTSVHSDGKSAQVDLADGTSVDARFVMFGCAPAVADVLLDRPRAAVTQGAQMKMNMLLTRLPRLRSGMDPRVAFAGTLHLDEAWSQLDAAFKQATAGELPAVPPAEVYCHSLADDSILSPQLAQAGYHTLTLFGLHTPADLFDADNAGARAVLTQRYLDALDAVLDEPIRDCLAVDVNGELCLEVKSPLDLEGELGLPRGNIFHTALEMPFDDERCGGWGVETTIDNIYMCGAGALRGGGVSGLGGHNAAHALMQRLGLSWRGPYIN
jgi:phytoene dehydrogenase-like protein